MLLCGVGAGAIVVVLVVDSVAEFFADLRDRIAEGARHRERASLLHNLVSGHSGEFHAVALGGKRKVNREFVERDEPFGDSHEVVGFAGTCRKQ